MSQTVGDGELIRRALEAAGARSTDGAAAEVAAALDACGRLAAGAAEASVYDEFLATLSHELRGPLSVIIGWIDLLRTDKLADPERTRALEIVERNAKIQARLIEDLVEASRVASGRMRIDVATVPAVDLVLGVVESMRPQAAASKVSLGARTDPPFDLRGDALRLGQVVSNMLGNSLRYTPPGGVIEVSLTHDAETATFVVADTGAGIEAELLPHVFDRFRQGLRVRSGGSRGLGLGLYIVRHIVVLHGGTITVESPGPGRGSTFTVALPLLGPPPSADR